jgi:hypothetical protein
LPERCYAKTTTAFIAKVCEWESIHFRFKSFKLSKFFADNPYFLPPSRNAAASASPLATKTPVLNFQHFEQVATLSVRLFHPHCEHPGF